MPRQYRIRYTIKGDDAEPKTLWPGALDAGSLGEGELDRMVNELTSHDPQVERAWVQYREVALWTDIREDGTTQDG